MKTSILSYLFVKIMIDLKRIAREKSSEYG
jgi:hypothetical protein